ncbi:MAG: glycosyltransferase family 4 protein [bacterium]|nr:glycosyltransferase family 4 protein [bacterium]
MKKVLIVTYVFPPMAAVGGQRLVNFCKFLPEYGWEPVVLTVQGGTNSAWDESPLADIPNVKIYRTRTFEPLQQWEARQRGNKPQAKSTTETPTISTAPAASGQSFLSSIKRTVRLALSVPDHAIFWVPLGFATGKRVIREEKIDAVFSSSPPVSAHLLASALAHSAKLPHIVDFRDLWTLNHAYPLRRYPEAFVRYDRFWERRVLSRAAHVTTASPGFSSQMESHLDGRLASRVTTITNGFDYREVDLTKDFTTPGSHDTMRFFYAGSLYGEFNPIFFLECLQSWMTQDQIDPTSVQVDFYGNSDRDYSILVERLGLTGRVTFHGFKSRKELLPLFPQADCLLLFLGFGEQYATVIPAKVFDYLAAGTEILALAPAGVSTGLIEKYNAGSALHTSDREKLIATLRQLYQKWKTNKDRKRMFRHIPEIDRRQLTGELAKLLDRMTAQG